MKVLLNELSLHGQFSSVCAFHNAIKTVMTVRGKMRQFGCELYCHRNLTQAQVTHDSTFLQAIQLLALNERRAVMSWLTQYGPFWEDERQHEAGDYLEHQSSIVTDTAIGEAAYHGINGGDYHTFSFDPSIWQFSPIHVIWHRENDTIHIDVINHWHIDSLQATLRSASPPIQTWQQLASDMPIRCPNLTFSDDSFNTLYSHPFLPGAAQRIVELLVTLDKFKTCFNAQGQRTEEGHRLYQSHFTGQKAWFSDSSDEEKIEFKAELTFNHQIDEPKSIFCSWHGKVKTPQIRIHFSWPVRTDEPVYVPYIGPKITKK
ncbi:MAG: hypothetical protein HOP34_14835 [Methylococcaceae bacterium]|nr:hypothetical protein [Methylococcaceae bacterium]